MSAIKDGPMPFAVHGVLPPDPMWAHMVGQSLAVRCMRPLDDNPIGKGNCCCNCVHHLPDHSHPTTNGRACTERRGWICAAPEMGLTSGWGEHGGCECHEPVEEAEREVKP